MRCSGAQAPIPTNLYRSRDQIASESQRPRSEEHTSELQSPCNLVCRLLLEKKNTDQFAMVVARYELFFTTVMQAQIMQTRLVMNEHRALLLHLSHVSCRRSCTQVELTMVVV